MAASSTDSASRARPPARSRQQHERDDDLVAAVPAAVRERIDDLCAALARHQALAAGALSQPLSKAAAAAAGGSSTASPAGASKNDDAARGGRLGSHALALETARVIRDVVAHAKVADFAMLERVVLRTADVLALAAPKEFVITNIARRIVSLIADEYRNALARHLNGEDSTAVGSKDNDEEEEEEDEDEDDELSDEGEDEADHSLANSTMSAGAAADASPTATKSAVENAHDSLFALLGHGSKMDLSSSHPATTTTRSGPAHQQQQQVAASQRHAREARRYSRLSPRKDKAHFTGAIDELVEEIEHVHRAVADYALEHIHAGEYIMTMGRSRTVEAFLRAAFRKRQFTVLVCESAPSHTGRAQALALARAGVPCVLVPDSNAYALLSRCSKVVLGAKDVLADGSVRALAGSHALALAAHALHVPVIVTAAIFKFAPAVLGPSGGAHWHARDVQALALSNDPGADSDDDDDDGDGARSFEGAQEEHETVTVSAGYDLVAARLVALYISNLGAHPPALLHRLLSDQYS